jgi:hypothetical protein
MPASLKPLLLAMRVTAVVALLLGIIVWTGRSLPWRHIHMATGLLLGLLLLAVGFVVMRATGRAGALLAALAWTVFLATFGVAHEGLWLGSTHWVAQLLHLLSGLATLGIAEGLAARVRRAASA